ncbi:peptidoglycan-associated lipoprotein Pal [Motiliproteus sp. MSK22-1]|uniref:peptidoglycan-associated lipoprotein Pal n=1 Tax=Motiliproteus sp. MSK22-1 TaxID=1897630 RepID=UPI000978A879|nr:peptidoglycan-associated lipoprotein Pal [Motiliproteus sp. MSK22-1]OMH38773.1 peptidoglycan-associated lipoprotein [Motiliproteus sp. MSK22-1]
MRLGNLKAIAIAASVIWAAGCSTTSQDTDSGDSMDHTQQQTDEGSATSQGTDSSSMTHGQMDTDTGMTKADVMSLTSVFYFDFDQAVVRAEAFADLSAHAKFLVDNPSQLVVLEGHADERGTREYNMALGERRAKAISRYLTVQGVSNSQIEIVSYGEERPAVIGHSEDAWGQNRRVEIKY